jgi:hypothetical protein
MRQDDARPHPQISSDVDFPQLERQISSDLDTTVVKARQNGGVEDQDSWQIGTLADGFLRLPDPAIHLRLLGIKNLD